MNKKDEPTPQNNRDSNALKGFMDYANGYYEGLKANQRVEERLKKSKGWVIDMLTNPNLSQAGENNPPSYPKVPEYVPPTGIRYSSDEIEKIQSKVLRNYVLNNMLIIRYSLINADELYERIKAISEVSTRIVGDICLHEGKTTYLYGAQCTPSKSPKLLSQNRIKYCISIVGGSGETLPEISVVYVERNITSITEVLKKLKEMRVENQEEKFTIEWLLNEMLWKMQNK